MSETLFKNNKKMQKTKKEKENQVEKAEERRKITFESNDMLYKSNKIKTSKYTCLNFLFINLYE